MSVGVRWSSD